MRRIGLCFAIALILAVALPGAWAATDDTLVHGSVARAFGVRVHVVSPLGDPSVEVDPTPLASAADPSVSRKTERVLGPLRAPEDGSVVSDARALIADASRGLSPAPAARAEALVSHVALFEESGVPLIEAETVRAVSDTACAGSSSRSSAAGSTLAGLRVAGQVFDATPEPNTEIPLVYDAGTPADASDDLGVRLILNEQTPAAQGAGLIVTMIHAILYTPADPANIFADVRIAESFSTVWCGGGGPRPVRIIDFDKVATRTDSDPRGALDDGIATAHRGETVTWTVTITNRSDTGCGLATILDSLPPHFGFVRTGGEFIDVVPEIDGRDVIWTPAGRQLQLDAGATITQTITARVASDAPYGTYTNLFTIFESSCSEATGGLLGPVTVIPRPQAIVQGGSKRPRPLAATGVPLEPVAAAAVALVTAGLLGHALRRVS